MIQVKLHKESPMHLGRKPIKENKCVNVVSLIQHGDSKIDDFVASVIESLPSWPHGSLTCENLLKQRMCTLFKKWNPNNELSFSLSFYNFSIGIGSKQGWVIPFFRAIRPK